MIPVVYMYVSPKNILKYMKSNAYADSYTVTFNWVCDL